MATKMVKTNWIIKVLITTFLLIIFITVSNALCATAYSETQDTQSCPEELPLPKLSEYVKDKKWISINFNDCLSVQTAVIKNIEQVISSDNFYLYVPLMNKKTMKIIRNAFFAAKGYELKDDTLRSLFQAYPWYKVKKDGGVKLTTEEERKVDVLNKIEDNWLAIEDFDDDYLKQLEFLSNLNVIKKKDKTYLKLADTLIDITTSHTVVNPDADSSKGEYTVIYDTAYALSDISGWKSIAVCKEDLPSGVDAVYVKEIDLYSITGRKKNSYSNVGKNPIYGLSQCPKQYAGYSDIVVSMNHNGCCGAISDSLITFNRKMQPVTVIDCKEGTCGGMQLIEDLLTKNLYIYLVAGPTSLKTEKKNGIYFFSYDRDVGRPQISALWSINKDGSLKLLSQVKKLSDELPQKVDLFPNSSKLRCNYKIAAAVKIESNLVLFWINDYYDKDYCGTTVIPLQ